MSSKSKKLGAFADIYQREHLDGAITKIKLAKIYPSEHQPRSDRLKAVPELAASIKKDGLLSPIVVTKEDNGYRIIAGERRYHAVKSLGWADIECRIISREIRDYKRIALIENLQREELSATEEAAALMVLKKQEDLSDLELGKTIGKSRNYVTEILGIALMPEEIITACQQAGIHNKNILIQAVQSWKKGKFDSFLKAFKSGEIKTVKQAKSHNKPGHEKTARQNTRPATSHQQSMPAVTIEKSTITINCKTPDEAHATATRIKKLLNPIKSS